MGSLILPEDGLVYLDASPIIYAIEKIPPYVNILQPLWQMAASDQVQLIGSELLILETLVKPIQHNNQELEQAFRGFLNSKEMLLLSISSDVLEKAIQLRAEFGIKTPDAIHAATALIARCNLFLTNDKGFKRIPQLSAKLLKNYL